MKVLTGKNTYIYSMDAAFRGCNPERVFILENVDEIEKVMRLKIPLIPRASGTNLTGATTPAGGESIVVFSALDRIKKIDIDEMVAVVEPGVTNMKLQEALKRYGFFYPPDPASQITSTIAGNFATNAGGMRCFRFGSTKNNVRKIKGFFGSGEYFEFDSFDNYPDIIGFLSGTEGGVALISELTVDILKEVPTAAAVFYFLDLHNAMEFVMEVISSGILPYAIEGVDFRVMGIVKPDLKNMAAIIISGESDELKRSIDISKKFTEKYETSPDSEEIWSIRKLAYPSLAKIKNNVLVEDGVVPRSKLAQIVEYIMEVEKETGIKIYSVFHAGDGNIHPQIPYDENDDFEKIKNASRLIIEKCIESGGSISGEHGVGKDKLELMNLVYGVEEHRIFIKLKNAFDPLGVLNPGKTINFKPVKTNKGLYSKFVDYFFEKKKNGCMFIKGSGSVINAKNVLDVSILNKILEFDEKNFTITLQCGVGVDDLHRFLPQGYYLHFLNYTGSIGGYIATKRQIKPYLRNYILGMKILLSDGSILNFPFKVVKNSSGWDVPKLFIGSWGYFGVILEVTLKLFPYPQEIKGNLPQPFIPDKFIMKLKNVFDPEGIFLLWKD